jgi:hypothetical protein
MAWLFAVLLDVVEVCRQAASPSRKAAPSFLYLFLYDHVMPDVNQGTAKWMD